MKNYSKAQSHKGKAAYRTPSRWLSGRPEAIKRQPPTRSVKPKFSPRSYGG